MCQQRRALQIAGRDLVRGNIELPQEIGAGNVEGRREELDAELACVRLKRAVFADTELEELAMLSIRRSEAVFVVVRFVVRRTRVQTLIVALLQLDGIGTGELGLAKQLASLVDAALVVVPDLGNHITAGVIADILAADSDAACHCAVPQM